MYETSCEFLYKMIAERVRIKRDSLHLSNEAVLPDSPGLLSAIAHNKKNDKKNRYLIPDGSGSGVSNASYAETIAANLEFSSVTELFIGDISEIEAYSGCFFRLLMLDALKDESEKTRNIIEDMLSDYLPYAVYNAYFEAECAHPDDIRYYVPEEYQCDISDVAKARDEAIEFLYLTIADEFILSIHSIFKRPASLVKLDKKLSDYACNNLIKILKRNRIKNMYIDDVKKKICKGYESLVKIERYEETLSPETIGYHEGKMYEYRYSERQWFSLYLEYVYKLIKQQDYDIEELNGTHLINRWTPQLIRVKKYE